MILMNICSVLIFIVIFEYFFDKEASSPNIPTGDKISHVLIKNKDNEKDSNDFILSNHFISDKAKILNLANFFRENNKGWRYHSLAPMPIHSYAIVLEGNGNYSLSIFLDNDGHLGVNDGDKNGTKWKLLTREQMKRLMVIVK
jgi:hypothetical protein